jgi:hypothetical protein
VCNVRFFFVEKLGCYGCGWHKQYQAVYMYRIMKFPKGGQHGHISNDRGLIHLFCKLDI